MQILDAAQTSALLPMAALIDAVSQAAIELADGRIRCPERMVVPIGQAMRSGALLSMPAVAVDISVHKLISVMPGNAQHGLPAIQGHLTIFDGANGTPRLMLDGPTVTGRRTAAISLLALRTLHPQTPRHVLLIGAGVQAAHHLVALADIYPGLRVTVQARSADSAARLVASHSTSTLQLRVGVHGRDSAMHATSFDSHESDVVITCTTSREPVYHDAAHAGRLLIAVGAFQPEAAEIGPETVRASRIVVDDPASARHEAGDLIRAGVVWSDVQALHSLLCPVANAPVEANTSNRPLLFKSVGCAAWDLAAARVALCTQLASAGCG